MGSSIQIAPSAESNLFHGGNGKINESRLNLCLGKVRGRPTNSHHTAVKYEAKKKQTEGLTSSKRKKN